MKLRDNDQDFAVETADGRTLREDQELQALQRRLTKLTHMERALICGMILIITIVMNLLGKWMYGRF